MDGFEDLRTIDGVEFDKAIWRHQNCDYSLPEETYIFYFDFRHRYWESFAECYWPFWKERSFIGAGFEAKPNPKLFAPDGEPLPEYLPALVLQDWIRKAVPIMQRIADSFGVDFRPFLWFKRSIFSGERLSESDRRTTDDFLEQIEFHLGISNGTVNRERAAVVCGGTCSPTVGHNSDASSDHDAAPRHSTDFRSVYWFGVQYAFSDGQAKCVEILWNAWQNRTPTIGERTIMAEAELAGDRLRDVFRSGKNDHPAWNTMIVTDGKGAFRLKSG